MKQYEHKEIPKGLGDRFLELIQSLQIIRDSLQAVNDGRSYQLVPLYGQMRALLTEKSKQNKPLLLDLAKQTGAELEIYAMPGPEANAPKVIHDALLHFWGPPITLEQQLETQQLVSLADFLQRPVLKYKNRQYQLSEIIDFFANKAGGAHYSTHLPRDLAEVLSIALNGEPVLVNGFRQVADAIYKTGINLLKSLADFEIHTLLVLPKQDLQHPGYIFEHKYPDSEMTIFAMVGPGMKLSFGIQTPQKTWGVVRVERILDWSQPLYLIFSASIQNNCFTKLEITVNGEVFAANLVPFPLFVINDPRGYESYQNRSGSDENAGLVMGMSEQMMYRLINSPRNRARLFSYFDEKLNQAELKVVHFRPGQYGFAPPGNMDLEMFGGPKFRILHKAKGYSLE